MLQMKLLWGREECDNSAGLLASGRSDHLAGLVRALVRDYMYGHAINPGSKLSGVVAAGTLHYVLDLIMIVICNNKSIMTIGNHVIVFMEFI